MLLKKSDVGERKKKAKVSIQDYPHLPRKSFAIFCILKVIILRLSMLMYNFKEVDQIVDYLQ